MRTLKAMPVIERIGRFRITQVSPKSANLYGVALEYLRSVGHTRRQVGSTPLFTVRDGLVAVAAFGTADEARAFVQRANAEQPPPANDQTRRVPNNQMKRWMLLNDEERDAVIKFRRNLAAFYRWKKAGRAKRKARRENRNLRVIL